MDILTQPTRKPSAVLKRTSDCHRQMPTLLNHSHSNHFVKPAPPWQLLRSLDLPPRREPMARQLLGLPINNASHDHLE